MHIRQWHFISGHIRRLSSMVSIARLPGTGRPSARSAVWRNVRSNFTLWAAMTEPPMKARTSSMRSSSGRARAICSGGILCTARASGESGRVGRTRASKVSEILPRAP